MGEQIINEWHEKTGIPSIVFRFTNPVGANTQYMIGDHSKTNQMQLIPYVVNCSINDKEIVLRGNNYNTLDGTPIRSYIHISDLAKSVVCALEKFDKNIEVYNIGNRKLELSTRQIVEAVSGVIGKEVKYTFVDSGKCENARIACNYDKFNNDFGYESVLGVEEIIKSQIAFDNFINEK
jgi:UDP-glucose 4-epimerase